ncbi:hypothetical protein [Williamsia deligens]|uniref:Uncharacterized protein n=1 Tax=Williamsia deligens TaxID=321325 RepID=A0ABW3G886_9NOCA|nr:hypothetical protein [Williamsia deligens]MCP2194006.1 hypothetical protein [Williamsia deligens]
MSIATSITRVATTDDAVDAARVLGGCRGPGVSARLRDSGLLDLSLAPADGGVAPSTAAEVVRILAVSHLDIARQVRESLLRGDTAVGHDLVERLLSVAVQTGVAAATLYSSTGTVRDRRRDGGRPVDDALRRRIGEATVAVAAAESTLRAAGDAVDTLRTSADDPDLIRDEAVVSLTTAAVLADRAAGATVDPGDLARVGHWTLTGRVDA